MLEVHCHNTTVWGAVGALTSLTHELSAYIIILEIIAPDGRIKEADDCLLLFYITTKIQENRYHIYKRDGRVLFVSF